MFSMVITDRSGTQRRLRFDLYDITIGRLESNDVVLERENVSKRHCRLVCKDSRYVLVDLGSTNGTYVNGRRISTPVVVQRGDKIYIGDYILALEVPRVSRPAGWAEDCEPDEEATPSAPPDATVASTRLLPKVESAADDGARSVASQADDLDPFVTECGTDDRLPALIATPSSLVAALESHAPLFTSHAARDETTQDLTSPTSLIASTRLRHALRLVMEELFVHMDVHLPYERAADGQEQAAIATTIEELDREGRLASDTDRNWLAEHALSEAVGLGPLDRLLADRSILEIVVDGPDRICVDRGDGLMEAPLFFSSMDAIWTVARRLWKRAGMTLLEERPLHEVRLPDGAYVQLVLPPITASGPLIAIRRRRPGPVSGEGLLACDMLNADMLSVLANAMRRRDNVLVTGPAGSGVSTLLSALAGMAGREERMASIEDVPGLALPRGALVLRRTGLSLRELIKRVVRMRVDRVLVDDLSPEDASAVLALAVGWRGLVVGMHGIDPEGGLDHLARCAQLQGISTEGVHAIARELTAKAFQWLMHVERCADGKRRVIRMFQLYETAPVQRLRFRYEAGAFVDCG